MDALHAPVSNVALAPDETLLLERLDDARHRRRPYLLRRGQLPERARPAEDEHGQRRQLRRWNTGRGILAADMTQRVNRGGVEAVRGLD